MTKVHPRGKQYEAEASSSAQNGLEQQNSPISSCQRSTKHFYEAYKKTQLQQYCQGNVTKRLVEITAFWLCVFPATLLPAFLLPLMTVFFPRNGDIKTALLLSELVWSVYVVVLFVKLSRELIVNDLVHLLLYVVVTAMSLASLLSGNDQLNIFGHFSFLRIIALWKPSASIRRFVAARTTTSFVRLSNAVIGIFVLNHLLACFFLHLVHSQANASTWPTFRMQESSTEWESEYLQALYFTTQTLFTVGYGDLSPITLPEKLLSSLYSVLGAIVFGFIMACGSSTVKNFNLSSSNARYKREMLRTYMQLRKIPKQIMNYTFAKYDVYAYKLGGNFQNAVLKDMPLCISRELGRLDSMLLKSVTIFRGCDDIVVQRLAEHLTPKLYLSSEVIATSEDLRSTVRIEIVRRGIVHIVSEVDARKSIWQQSICSAIGEYQTVQHLISDGLLDIDSEGTGSAEACTYVSKATCDTLCLPYDKLKMVLVIYEEEQKTNSRNNRRRSIEFDSSKMENMLQQLPANTIGSECIGRKSTGLKLIADPKTVDFHLTRVKKMLSFLVTISSVWYVSSIPLQIAQTDKCSEYNWPSASVFDWLSDTVMLLDIILHFWAYHLRAFKETNNLYETCGKIFVCFPGVLFAPKLGANSGWYRVNKLYALRYLFTGLSKAKLIAESHGRQIGSDVMFQLRISLSVLFFIHLTSCAAMQILNVDCLNYEMGLYWTLTTFTTTGFGDVVPTTKSGYLFAVCVMYTGVFLYGALVASITALFHKANVGKGDPSYRFEITQWFLKDIKADKMLEQRITAYLSCYAATFGSIDEASLLKCDIPPDIERRFNKSIVEKFVRAGTVLGQFPSSIKDAMVKDFVVNWYVAGDTINSPYEGAYFIHEGKILIHGMLTDVVNAIVAGDSFGIGALFDDDASDKYYARVVKNSEIYFLGRSEFQQCIQKENGYGTKSYKLACAKASAYEEALYNTQEEQNTRFTALSDTDLPKQRRIFSKRGAIALFHFIGSGFIVWNFLSLPARIAFLENQASLVSWRILDHVGDTWFIFEFSWRYFRKQCSYKSLDFKLSFFSLLPFELLSTLLTKRYENGFYFAICRVNKLVRCRRFNYHRQHAEYLFSGKLCKCHSNIKTVANLVVIMMSAAHIIACMWYFLGRVNPQMNWAKNDGAIFSYNVTRQSNVNMHEHEMTGYWYLRSLYFVMATLTTVGYGDITASNSDERIFTICLFIVGTFIFTFVIGSLEKIIAQLDVTSTLYSNKVDSLKLYFQVRTIPGDIQATCFSYYDHLWKSRKGARASDVMSIFPSNLRADVLFAQAEWLLTQLTIVQHCSKHIHRKLASKMQQDIIMGNQCIFECGELADVLYFLLSGEIRLMSKSCETIFTTISSPSAIEEGDFLMNLRRSCTAKTGQRSIILILTREDFETVFENYYENEHRSWDALRREYQQDTRGKSLVRKLMLNMKSSKMMKMQAVESNRGNEKKVSTWALDSRRRRVWESIMFVMIVYDVCSTAFRVVASTSVSQALSLYLISLAVDILYSVDIVLRLRKFMYLNADGTLIADKEGILQHHIASFEFKVEVVSLIPIDFFVWSLGIGNGRAVAICRLLRLGRLYHAAKAFDHFIALVETAGCNISTSSSRFMKMIGMILIWSHFAACVFVALSWATRVIFDPWTERNTVAGYTVSESDNDNIYGVSVYWSVYTVTSVGYGDILPKTAIETLWAIVMMVSASFLCDAGVTAILSSWVDGLDSKAALANQKIANAVKYINIREVPSAFLIRVKQCLTAFHITNQGMDEQHVFSNLSFVITNEILTRTMFSVFRKHKDFSHLMKTDEGLVLSILKAMVPHMFYPKERLGQINKPWGALYFLLNGEVKNIGSNRRIAVVPKKSLLGYPGRVSRVESIASSFTETYKIDAPHFKRLLDRAVVTLKNEKEFFWATKFLKATTGQ